MGGFGDGGEAEGETESGVAAEGNALAVRPRREHFISSSEASEWNGESTLVPG